MAEAHLDTKGEVQWFPRYGPRPVVGPCPHDCSHDRLSVIAWGPDYDHYCLHECADCACRGWSREYPEPFTAGPKFQLLAFSQVAL